MNFKKWSKYLLAGCLAATMAFVIAGCGGDDSASKVMTKSSFTPMLTRKHKMPSKKPSTTMAMKGNTLCSPSVRLN